MSHADAQLLANVAHLLDNTHAELLIKAATEAQGVGYPCLGSDTLAALHSFASNVERSLVGLRAYMNDLAAKLPTAKELKAAEEEKEEEPPTKPTVQ